VISKYTNIEQNKHTFNGAQQSTRRDIPYAMFKFSTRSEVTRKYYERRIRLFFDFTKFCLEDKADLEQRCNAFASKGTLDVKWAIEQIVNFLQFQKDRVEKGEITAATLRNYVKSLRLFCDVCDITVPWKKITRGLPRGRQASNDRASSRPGRSAGSTRLGVCDV
jgi:hypothetical protein